MADDSSVASGTQVPITVTNTNHNEFNNTSHPYFISPSDSPGTLLTNAVFDGRSFGGWKRGMWIALTAKNKSGFVDGSSPKSSAGTDKHRAWSRANNMVISWLLNSLSREISESVLYYSTAKDIWTELEARFGQSSGDRLFQLQKELSDLIQGASDIASYFTKKKRLWDELDTLDSFSPCLCVCSCGAKQKNIKFKQDERLLKFLMGLNDTYCGARGNILMISPLPTVSNAYALLIQEEKQREVKNTPKFPGESSSFVAANANNGNKTFTTDFRTQRQTYENKKSGMVCKYCKKTGHLIDKCYKLHGFPTNFKFTKQSNFQNNVQGNVVSSNDYSWEIFANNTDEDEGVQGKPLSTKQLAQVMQMLQDMNKDDQGPTSEVTASANCTGPFNEEPNNAAWGRTEWPLCPQRYNSNCSIF
ncbi:uncharacterized protein LOC129903789 [Solanum dulcamara]|uniref:uncharacterized protein LOC129903789 n=1 Tax=Solanum dulcamara TaxID=45834 RepID=UPI0024866B73|nr:uncharacterized protein LOC129903789 [Solanum dulcamara]